MKRKKQRKHLINKTVRAGFTIEAAFICPVVLLTICTMLLNAFRLHDRVLERTALSLELSTAAACSFRGTEDAAGRPAGDEAGETSWYFSDRTQKLLHARIYDRENGIRIERGFLRVRGAVGDYEESRSLIRPEEILRRKVLLEEGDH